MPVMDGIEATRQIRNPQSAVLDHLIPIIALTANAMQSDRQNCLASGMNDFVPKPIVQGVLRDALQKWLPTGASAIPAAASLLQPARLMRSTRRYLTRQASGPAWKGTTNLYKLYLRRS